MSQISRKELKSDEFVSGMDAALEFFLQHRDRIIVAAVILAVALGGGYGIYAWRASRNQRAAAMLAEALTTLHAPLLGPTTPQGTAAYASPATRGTAAAQQFQAVISQYPSTAAGQLARYYLGLAQLDALDPSAEKNLQAAADSGDAVASTAAKNALANLDIQQGKLPQAHALLLELSKQDSATMPRAVALMELADLDRTYNPTEAAQYYRQLQADYPSTQTAQQAGQQLAAIGK
ncbi:MAG TPA: hypothetical protein VN515_08170 [Terriglobales bacterium]|nr:hypothetical protein [Terriglobales bacterium]